MVTRRELFATSGLATMATVTTVALGGALTGCDPVKPATAGPARLDPRDWNSVRDQFALDPTLTNFATFYLASHPAPVRAAIDKHRAGLDADTWGYIHDQEPTLNAAAANAAATYLGTDPGLIAFTDSTTMGLGLLYGGMGLNPGDEVLSTEHDFFATNASLDTLAARTGATVRRVRLYDEPEQAVPQQMVDRIVAGVGPRTKVVAITWVHSSSGVKLPIRAIADAVQGRGVLLCVDGVHAFGIEDAGPAELGCDFLVSGTHKWLFGPRGTGIIWGRREAWPATTALIPSFTDDGQPGGAHTPGGFHTFEHRWAVAEAFAFHTAIGRSRVAERTHQLATALKDGLAGIAKVRLRTPRPVEASAGIVCCDVDGYSPAEAVTRLRQAGIGTSTTPYTRSFLRFGPSIINNESDVDKALVAVRSL